MRKRAKRWSARLRTRGMGRRRNRKCYAAIRALAGLPCVGFVGLQHMSLGTLELKRHAMISPSLQRRGGR